MGFKSIDIKEIVYEEIDYDPFAKILKEIRELHE